MPPVEITNDSSPHQQRFFTLSLAICMNTYRYTCMYAQQVNKCEKYQTQSNSITQLILLNAIHFNSTTHSVMKVRLFISGGRQEAAY